MIRWHDKFFHCHTSESSSSALVLKKSVGIFFVSQSSSLKQKWKFLIVICIIGILYIGFKYTVIMEQNTRIVILNDYRSSVVYRLHILEA